jgi:hypothetical protein
MVLIKTLKNLFKIFLIIAFIFLFSCEDQGLIVKCPDCTTDEPIKTNLEIKTDLAYLGNETQINIYEGNIEDSILYFSYKTSGTLTKINVTLNKKYSATATYYIPDNYYIALDSATPRVRFDKTKCDDPCYFVYDKIIDLRLKYTK